VLAEVKDPGSEVSNNLRVMALGCGGVA